MQVRCKFGLTDDIAYAAMLGGKWIGIRYIHGELIRKKMEEVERMKKKRTMIMRGESFLKVEEVKKEEVLNPEVIPALKPTLLNFLEHSARYLTLSPDSTVSDLLNHIYQLSLFGCPFLLEKDLTSSAPLSYLPLLSVLSFNLRRFTNRLRLSFDTTSREADLPSHH